LRELLDVEPKDKGGIHHSEAMGNISEVFPLRIPARLSQNRFKTTAENRLIQPVKLGEPSVVDRIEAGISYARFMESKSQGERANVFFQLGLRQEDMQALAQLLKNPNQYTRKDFQDQLLIHCRTAQESLNSDAVLLNFNYLIQANQMRFKDSFSVENESENITALINKVKAIRNQGEYVFRDLVNLNGHPVPMLKRRILELANQATDAEKLKIVSWLVFLLKPEHFTPEFVFELMSSVQRQMVIINQPFVGDPAKVRDNNKNSGYYRIITTCFPYNEALATEVASNLQAPWKLSYYFELPVALRAKVPAFKEALLWSFREGGQDQKRQFLKSQLSITEFVSILNGNVHEVDRFTDAATAQIAEKLADTCREIGNSACGAFLAKYYQFNLLANPQEKREIVKATLFAWQS
jgi:hypothetical protein